MQRIIINMEAGAEHKQLILLEDQFAKTVPEISLSISTFPHLNMPPSCTYINIILSSREVGRTGPSVTTDRFQV